MLFFSFPFATFILVVFFLYFIPFKRSSKWQNYLLLASSYFFYGFADVKMIPLLFFATVVFFFLAKFVHTSAKDKKANNITLLGVISGLGILFYYKYFNFFVDSLNEFFLFFNITDSHWQGFNIIMPLGISFFTFKLISYIIEVNRGKIEPANDFIAFAVYISFFPTIMSGPIDRPNTFLSQLKKYHNFDYNLAVCGCRQFVWGLFQKMVIADNLATYTNYVWGNLVDSTGITLIFAAILFTFQMYADFSGYSHMAIGIGKLLGFEISKNFNYPLFATNISEYWRRWHMTLTSWLTDYVFMPLNIRFRNMRNFGIILAIITNMVLVGIWHGSNWKFAVFGLYHGLLFIPLILNGALFKKKKVKENKFGLPQLSDFIKMILTFILVTIGLVIFNSKDLGQAVDFYRGIFSKLNFSLPQINEDTFTLENSTLIFLFIFIFIEWIHKKSEYAFKNIGLKWHITIRWLFLIITILTIVIFTGKNQQFIYFKF